MCMFSITLSFFISFRIALALGPAQKRSSEKLWNPKTVTRNRDRNQKCQSTVARIPSPAERNKFRMCFFLVRCQSTQRSLHTSRLAICACLCGNVACMAWLSLLFFLLAAVAAKRRCHNHSRFCYYCSSDLAFSLRFCRFHYSSTFVRRLALDRPHTHTHTYRRELGTRRETLCNFAITIRIWFFN